MLHNISRKWKVIVLCIYSAALTETLKYDELEILGVSCPPKDTCFNRTEVNDNSDETCECQGSCARRGTCCIDSPNVVDSVSTQDRETCISIPSYCTHTKGMWAVTKCSSLWNESYEVTQKCEGDPSKIGNVLMSIPASNPTSGITYLNYFCAVCNNDHSDAVLWNVTVYRLYTLIPEDICEDQGPHDLQYEQDTKEWGFLEKCFSKSWSVFVPVKIEIGMPPFPLKYCDTDVIGLCATDWDDNSIKEKCEAYTAVIMIHSENSEKKYYRNAHCAICNHVRNFAQAFCSPLNAHPLDILCPLPDPNITEVLSHRIVNENWLGEMQIISEEKSVAV